MKAKLWITIVLGAAALLGFFLMDIANGAIRFTIPYATETIVNFELYDSNSPHVLYLTGPATADCNLFRDEGNSESFDNDVVDEGPFFSWTISATEATAKILTATIRDASTPALFMDQVIIVTTTGHASSFAGMPLVDVNLISGNALPMSVASMYSDAATAGENATAVWADANGARVYADSNTAAIYATSAQADLTAIKGDNWNADRDAFDQIGYRIRNLHDSRLTGPRANLLDNLADSYTKDATSDISSILVQVDGLHNIIVGITPLNVDVISINGQGVPCSVEYLFSDAVNEADLVTAIYANAAWTSVAAQVAKIETDTGGDEVAGVAIQPGDLSSAITVTAVTDFTDMMNVPFPTSPEADSFADFLNKLLRLLSL